MSDHTDRELLERAAKAAGYERWYWERDRLIVGSLAHEVRWNPLTNDGDCFRLMVRKKFHVCIFSAVEGYPGFVEVWREGDNDPLRVELVTGTDYDAATRRAIVRAAGGDA